MIILVSNDDGYRAPGVAALARMVDDLGTVYTVAPDREQSASSHALTLHRPLRVEPEGARRWAVDGTPTDCVHLAIRGDILPNKPELVLSGINHGSNLGDEVTYSGTVAAAMEGCLLGKPAIAFSCVSRDPEGTGLEDLTPWVQKIVRAVSERGLPANTLLNVNFPDPRRTTVRGLKITTQGRMMYGAKVVEKTDPRNRKYYWIGGEVLDESPIPGSDVEAVTDGFASITPIHLNLTDWDQLKAMDDWDLGGIGQS